ncbi:MAG: hypothetical protein BBJ60_11655 [Desulfobacterales bacterium S7086C20]|nr:MAG: hypothetical protein BBJ60_11655 [Desulfobacterales bacterium S7086C20]
MKNIIKALLTITLTIIFVSGCTSDNISSSNSQAPLFAMEDIHGDTVRLKDLRGKVILLNFFATWCGPCRQEVPEFIRVYEKLKDKGFEIVAIGLDAEGAGALRPFARNYKIPYTILPGTRNVVLDYGGIKSIPTTFLIDHNGRVADHFVGWRSASMLEQSIVKLLSRKV